MLPPEDEVYADDGDVVDLKSMQTSRVTSETIRTVKLGAAAGGSWRHAWAPIRARRGTVSNAPS
jgi:hypothetical protein